MEAVNDGALDPADAGRAAAATALISAGVGAERAREIVAGLQGG